MQILEKKLSRSERVEFPFLLLEYLAVLLAAGIGLVSESYHPLLLLGCGLLVGVWIERLARTKRFAPRTPVDLPLVLFLLTALVAWYIAPLPALAFPRLYLFWVAVSLFYLLAGSGRRALFFVTRIGLLFVGAGSLLLASQNEWNSYQARFPLARRLGIAMGGFLPNLGVALPDWNILRNIIAGVAAPAFIVGLVIWVASLHKWQRQKDNLTWLWDLLVTGFGLLLLVASLILSESRSPVFFGILLAFLALVWAIIKRKLSNAFSQAVQFIVPVVVFLAVLGALTLAALPGLNLPADFPGPDNFSGRWEIFQQSPKLAQPTPFTGGGLAAFPALYSTYIQGVPFNRFLDEDTGNPAYYNILIEQGVPGLISYLAVLIAGIAYGITRLHIADNPFRVYNLAGLLALTYLALLGFIHSTMVSTRAIPFLLAPAGLVMAGLPEMRFRQPRVLKAGMNIHLPLALSLAMGLLLLLVGTSSSMRGLWQTNLVVLAMNRIQLAGFPRQAWSNGEDLADLAPVQKQLTQTATLLPGNPVLHYRLGLLAYEARHFRAAVSELSTAYALDPSHRGVRKALAYSLTWSGEGQAAIPMLKELPEAEKELKEYQHWWQERDQPDLARLANEEVNLLHEEINAN